MSQINRIDGGLIDQEKVLNFTFNGQILKGYEGDTLASALLANNKHLIGRSFKYHRPRGIVTAGSEEPNAIMEIGNGAYREPNTRATVTQLYNGLEANSQNHRGPLSFDFMAITDFLSPLLGAGFYYKTFMWPKSFWEKFYEPAIRKSAGLGTLSTEADPDTYDKGFRHCDILIIGSGATGLSAALPAAIASKSLDSVPIPSICIGLDVPPSFMFGYFSLKALNCAAWTFPFIVKLASMPLHVPGRKFDLIRTSLSDRTNTNGKKKRKEIK